MEGRWSGGPPIGAPRASLQSKQPSSAQQLKDRESTRETKNPSASSTSSSAFSAKGAPSGGPRGGQAASTKKPAAPGPSSTEPSANTQRGRVVSGSASSSSGGPPASYSSGSSSSSRAQPLQPLPPQTEEEFLRGCGFQAIWSENFEVSGLMNAAVKLCKLAPTEGDDEWQEAHLSFLHLLSLCRARLGRHQCLLQSRLEDVEDQLQMEEDIQARIKQYKEGISTARGELKVAELMRKRRKELDAMCEEVLKKPCLKETTQLEREEAERRIKAENSTKDITNQVATKKRQAEAAIQAAEDLFASPAAQAAAI